MKLDQKSDLGKIIHEYSDGKAEGYYDMPQSKLTVYYMGASKEEVNHFKLQIFKYIGWNLLGDSISTVSIFS